MSCRLLLRHLVVLCGCWSSSAAGAEDAAVRLEPSLYTPAISRAVVRYEVGGDLIFDGKDGKERKQKVPMSVVAELAYEERSLAEAEEEISLLGEAAKGSESMAVRHYEAATATVKIGQGGFSLKLPDDRRVILTSTYAGASRLISPVGPLTREELDLIDIPAGTHVLDRLMPGGTKRIGENWKHDSQTMQLLLGLDEISLCEVESVITGVERGYAKVRLAGSVHGKTADAVTELELKAGYLFDTRLGRITRMNLAFAEKREEGRVGPATDVVGKLTLEIDPLKESRQLTNAALATLDREVTAGKLLLLLDHAPAGLRLLHDRNWHVTNQERERLVLRRIEAGQLIAQCSASVRPERQRGRQDSLADFERDVRLSLGERFQSVVTSGEWTNAAGLKCYRVVAHGTVEELPMEWRYYLAAPAEGRSVVLAVSVEPRHAEQLGEADTALVESIQLLPAGTAAGELSAARPDPPARSGTVTSKQ